MKKYLLGFLLFSSINCYSNSLMMVSDKEMPLSSEHRREISSKKIEIQKNGYYLTTMSDRYSNFLLSIKKNAVQEKKAFSNSPNKGDSHLKESADNIKLAFKFKKLPIDDKNIIAYAPIGGYMKSPEGWNGIKIFFDNLDTGNVCAYEFMDLELSNGGVLMNKDGISNNVNSKPTVTDVQGNPASGFIYSVVWYNNLKVSRIDCVTTKFDNSVINKMTKLANKIDQNGLVVSH